MENIEKLMNNLNDVQKAIRINNLKSEFDKSFALEVINQAIQTVEELQSQIPKWHLCIEGDLPTDENDYLLYFKEGDSVLGWYSRPDKQWTNSSSNNPIIADVIAWMELPKFEEVE